LNNVASSAFKNRMMFGRSLFLWPVLAGVLLGSLPPLVILLIGALR
jgi:hypothetical protein